MARQILPYSAVAGILQCIVLCAARAPGAGGEEDLPTGDNVLTLDGPDIVAKKTDLRKILREEANRHKDVVVIRNGDVFFLRALVVLMEWCVLNEERSLCFYLELATFQRLQGWSYRFLWRQVATENDGLSIEMVIHEHSWLKALCGSVKN